MGYIRHDAIIVTGWQISNVRRAAEKATTLGLQVLGPGDEVVNGYISMLVSPDGSKEGWSNSDTAEDARRRFIVWMRKERELGLDWVLVRFGGDDPELATVTDYGGRRP